MAHLGYRPVLVGLLCSPAFLACVSSTNDPKKEPTVTDRPDSATGSGGGGSEEDGGSGGSGGSAGSGNPDAGTGGSAGAGNPDGGPEASTGSASLGGSLRVGSTFFVDSDHADPNNALLGNDTAQDSQEIGNPSTVGGFLGVPRGFDDPVDVYLVDLASNQAVTLFIGEPSDGSPIPDFDLALYDGAGDLVAESLGTGPVEMVEAPTIGGSGSEPFFIQVFQATSPPEDAPGLYTLTVGQRNPATTVNIAAASRLSASDPMVEGEALIRMRPGAQATTASLARDLGVRVLGGGRNRIGYYRVALPAPGGSKAVAGGFRHTRQTTIDAIKALRKNPGVLIAEPNYIRQAHADPPDDPLYRAQWHYPQINLLDAWDHSRGAGSIVAVLDTGVKLSHPDFENGNGSSQLVDGYDMISTLSIAADGDGRDANPDDPGDRRFPNDSSWHGTHCAGTVAAATNNGVGCAGVAPAARIMPVRVLGVGGGTNDDIIQGMLFAAGLSNDEGASPDAPADIISMSLGGPGRSALMADAVAAVRDAGVIVLASAGNSNDDATFYSPAGEVGVVTVGAVDIEKERAFYSNYGGVIDVAGPGGDESRDRNFDGFPDGVLSLTFANGGSSLYTPYQGTSMACPHVAGVAALMKTLYPAMTPNDFDDLLAGTFSGADRITEDLGASGRDDDFGHGLINANLAVLAAQAAADDPAPVAPALALSSRNLDFGNDLSQLALRITNAGTGTLSITNVTSSAPWLTVTPGSLGDNTVRVDRSGLSAGINTGTLTITSNGGTANVNVRVSVGANAVTGGNVGVVYVLLLDPDTLETLEQVITSADDDYAFSFADVAPGDYRIVAGTDLDDNGLIDDDGEAFGGYPLSSDPAIVTVSEDRDDIEFALQFQLNLGAASFGPAKRGRFRRLF